MPGAGPADTGDLVLEVVGRWPYGPAYAVAAGEVDGTPYAFLGSGGGVYVVDVTDPTTPTKVAEVATPGIVRGLSLAGDLLLVADGEAGLRVIDITDPASPTEVGFLDTPDFASGVAVSGSLALVADRDAGLRVIDISDPASPTEVGVLYTPGEAFGVAVSGSLALVADDYGGLRVIDITDPASPTEVGVLYTPGEAFGVAVSGSLALVADDYGGLRVIDITDPASPTEVGFLYTPGEAFGVAVSGSLALVADDYGGLRVIDITDPASPTEVGFLDTPGSAYGVAVSGSLALVADDYGGLRVIDITDPASPTEVGFLDTPDSAYGVAVSGSLALVADDDAGLLIVRFGPAGPGPQPPPQAVNDLAVAGEEVSGSFRLSWTSPGPDRAASYDVRYSREPITEPGWDSATPVPATPPMPGTPGARESFTVTSLPTGGPWDSRYYLALRSAGPGGDLSPVSNVPSTVRCPRAVVLVHGWLSSADGAWGSGGGAGDLDFAAGLEEAGFCVHSALDLDPSNRDISELAEQLGDVVDLVTAAGYGSVDLVAHSMGGLVSRYYTTYIDSSNVGNIVMLGTPNHGTTAATFGDLAVVLLCQAVLQTAHLPGSLCGLAADIIKGEAGKQMEAVYVPRPFLPDISRESPFLRDLNGLGLPEGVGHWTIAGTTALLGPWPGLLVLSGAFVLPNPDDGLVSAHSVCLNGSDAHYQYPINHGGLHEEASVLDRVSVILRGAPPAGVECTPSVEALGTHATGDTPSVPQIVLSVTGTVSTGGEQVHGFPMEEGVDRASFIAAVSDPAVELSLQSPSGAIGTDSPAFSEEAEGLVKVYRLEAPASGDWSVVLALPEGTGDPASYRVEVWAEARLSLLLSTSRGLYLPGEAAELEAVLQAGGQPVTGGEATAIIATPGGGTAAIPLVESGDGIATRPRSGGGTVCR